jgi:hypothetical protein
MKKVFMSAAIVAMMAAAVACGNNNNKKAEEPAAEEPAAEAAAPEAKAEEELDPISAAVKAGVEQVEGAVTDKVVEGVGNAASAAAEAIKK